MPYAATPTLKTLALREPHPHWVRAWLALTRADCEILDRRIDGAGALRTGVLTVRPRWLGAPATFTIPVPVGLLD